MNRKDAEPEQPSKPASVNRESVRLEVMRTIEANPEMSQREVARELGVSLGGVNYAMKERSISS